MCGYLGALAFFISARAFFPATVAATIFVAFAAWAFAVAT
jgi:hypothetical protein